MNFKGKVLSGFLSVCLAFTAIAFNASAVMAATTYEIATKADLLNFAQAVNGGEANANAVLLSDIVVNEGDIANCNGVNSGSWEEWTPIGNAQQMYMGVFDGQGHTVSGLYFNNQSAGYVGMFGAINGAEIKNLKVDNSYIQGASVVGGVCGFANGNAKVTNCSNGATVKGQANIGGVCCLAIGSTISGCQNTGNVTSVNDYAGGISGFANSNTSIINCVNTGNVSGNSYIAGVCGFIGDANAVNCISTGEIKGSSITGAICGTVVGGGSVSNCYYLAGCANGGINGSDMQSSTESKTAEEFANGNVAWLLNEKAVDDAMWYQNVDNGADVDSIPVLDSTHGVVYAIVMNDGTIIASNKESLTGDVDINGEVTEVDAVTLLKYIGGIDGALNIGGADVNNDGEINLNDVIAILNTVNA